MMREAMLVMLEALGLPKRSSKVIIDDSGVIVATYSDGIDYKDKRFRLVLVELKSGGRGDETEEA